MFVISFQSKCFLYGARTETAGTDAAAAADAESGPAVAAAAVAFSRGTSVTDVLAGFTTFTTFTTITCAQPLERRGIPVTRGDWQTVFEINVLLLLGCCERR